MEDKIDYWCYLEPYAFVFRGNDKFVIYNTLNSEYIDCSPYDNDAQTIVEELYLSNKSYCIGINKDLLNNNSFNEFLSKITRSFSGGIVKNKGKAPFIFKPVLRIYYDPSKSDLKDEHLLGLNTLLYLHEVSFYLENNENLQEYNDCFRQFLYPKNAEKQCLSICHYKSIIEQLAICQIDKVNIVPGNMEHTSLLMELLDLCHHYNLKTNVIIPYKRYLHTDLNLFFVNPKLTLKVLIHFPIDIKDLENQINLSENSNIVWCMILSGEEDAETIDKIAYSDAVKTEVLPWYKGNNMSFFRKYVFNTLDDIIGTPVSKQTLFRRQVLNENFFGKLLVFPDGQVHANANFPPVGNLLEQKLTQIVYNEICNPSNAWFMTREKNNTVCNLCVNRHLCPSISNYEIVTGIHNMCYLNIDNQ